MLEDAGWGIECGPGWADLIAATCDVHTVHGSPVRYSQIKEKYGSLRMYGITDDGDLADLEDHAELLSEHICERCGAPGQQRPGGWVSTLCDHHFAERLR